MQQRESISKIILKVATAVVNIFLNVIFYTVLIMLIVRVSNYAFNFSYQVFGSMSKEAEPGHDVEVQILKGESTMNIANKLENSNVIIDKYSFYVKTKLKSYDIMPGTFVLNTSMDYDEILEVITDITNSIAKEQTVEDYKDNP